MQAIARVTRSRLCSPVAGFSLQHNLGPAASSHLVLPACALATSSKPPRSRLDIIREKTPLGRVSDADAAAERQAQQASAADSTSDSSTRHRDAEKQPLKPWPGGRNPHTGEVGGPKGPEPTRYNDWERKGRAIDF